MSILDTFTNAISGQGGMQAMVAAAFQQSGGLEGVIGKLNQAGLGVKVNSWLGQGPNTPITIAEIESALGNDHLKQIAGSLGVPMDQVAALLSQHLPATIDAASPDGALQKA